MLSADIRMCIRKPVGTDGWQTALSMIVSEPERASHTRKTGRSAARLDKDIVPTIGGEIWWVSE